MSKGQKYFAKALKKFTLMHSNQLDLTYKSIKNQFGVSYPIHTYLNEVSTYVYKKEGREYILKVSNLLLRYVTVVFLVIKRYKRSFIAEKLSLGA